MLENLILFIYNNIILSHELWGPFSRGLKRSVFFSICEVYVTYLIDLEGHLQVRQPGLEYRRAVL